LWLIFAVFFNLNGISRKLLYEKIAGEYGGHLISTIVGIFAIFIGTYIFLKINNGDYEYLTLFTIGIIWLIMTISFEFLFGHFVIGHSWEKLLADYNIFTGRLWSLVLLSILLSPVIMGSLTKK
jgi:hypothetical protein